MKYVKTISELATNTGLALFVLLNLYGCGDSKQNENAFESYQNTEKDKHVVYLEEIAPNEYKIVNEVPSTNNAAFVKHINGETEYLNESFLKKQESDNTALYSVLGASILGYSLYNLWNPSSSFDRTRYYSSPSAYTKSASIVQESEEKKKHSSYSGGGGSSGAFIASSSSSSSKSATSTSSGFFSSHSSGGSSHASSSGS